MRNPTKIKAALAPACLLLFLVGFNVSVADMECLRESGTTLYLELSPVDPRALLLGDYMALDFTVNQDLSKSLRKHGGDKDKGIMPRSGYAIVATRGSAGKDQVAVFTRLDDGKPLQAGEYRLLYRARNNDAWVTATAFYFQEGQATAYATARYGEIRVDESGRNLLTHLLDAAFHRIAPACAPKGDAPVSTEPRNVS